MKHRPIQLIVLAFAQSLMGLGSLLFQSGCLGKWVWNFLPSVVMSGSAMDRIEYFLVTPILGLAIYSAKRWSWLTAVGCVLFSAVHGLVVFFHGPETSPSLLCLVEAMHLGLLGYLCLPAVRVAYWEPRVRWWETKPRYFSKTAVRVTQSGNTEPATLVDLAEGGLYLIGSPRLDSANPVVVCLEALPPIEGMITRKTDLSRDRIVRGYAIQFRHTGETRRALKGLLTKLKTEGMPSTFERRNWVQELKGIGQRFLEDGSGWVPGPWPKDIPLRDGPTAGADSLSEIKKSA